MTSIPLAGSCWFLHLCRNTVAAGGMLCPCLLWSPLQLGKAPRNYLVEFLWLSKHLKGCSRVLSLWRSAHGSGGELSFASCVYVGKGSECVSVLGSRVLCLCKELCKCTWSLSGEMQHRQSQNSLLLWSCNRGLCCPGHTGWKLFMIMHNRYHSGQTAGVLKGDLLIIWIGGNNVGFGMGMWGSIKGKW